MINSCSPQKIAPEAKTQYATHHWHKSTKDKRALSYEHLLERSKKRINRLFYGDGMKKMAYGLGDARSLDEYINFSGIDYKNKVIASS